MLSGLFQIITLISCMYGFNTARIINNVTRGEVKSTKERHAYYYPMLYRVLFPLKQIYYSKESALFITEVSPHYSCLLGLFSSIFFRPPGWFSHSDQGLAKGYGGIVQPLLQPDHTKA